MKNIVSILFLLLLLSNICFAQTWEQRKDDFRNIPKIYRPNPLWFWNNSTIERDEIKKQMKGFDQAGYGGLSILPFGKDLKPEYLTDAYFKTYKVCMEEAEKLDMKLWIYDEYGFPSGTAGDINGDGIGRFKLKYPEKTNKRLDKREYTPQTGQTFRTKISQSTLMAVVAMDTVDLRRIDLIDFVINDLLIWRVPEGKWKVMIFNCVDAGNTIVDYLDPEAADLYIKMTHESYYELFSEYFDDVVEGTFFDEPTMYYADGRTWTPLFNERFEDTYGFSPALYYPALWYDIGPETIEARNFLYGFRAQLFTEGYIKCVNDWSVKRGILATGHLDNEEILNSVGTSGDLMKSFKYLEIPGIDKIGGNRPAENFYKLITSAAYNWDHSLVMSETYGAMGNLDWSDIYSIAMDQYVKGINMLIPHAVWYDTDKVTFLPELSLRNPVYADSLKSFNDYLSRLNILLKNDGRWVGDIAILYPIHSMQGDHYFDGPLDYYKGGVEIPYLNYTDVSVTLFDSLGIDHIYLHPEVLNEKCIVNNGKLILENEIQYNEFSAIIISSSRIIDLENLKKILKFAESGGLVVFTTQLPSQATLHTQDDHIRFMIEKLFTIENVYFVTDPTPQNLNNVFENYSFGMSIQFSRDLVRNIHKVVDEKNIWFLANPDDIIKNTQLELMGEYDLEIWDPHSGEVLDGLNTIKYKNNKTYLDITIPAIYSLFLIEK